jgi:16S rRNA (guanine966-N2)-methyltransferase
VRVIAGTHRGRLLRAPPGTATRPTADRVREAIFDVLSSMTAMEGKTVLDLFAGSGAMGIEALSRGASGAVFVESDTGALRVIRANLSALGLEDRATVVRAEALGWLATPAGSAARFDLALCDPPYAFDAWTQLLAGLSASVAVLESSRPVRLGPDWALSRSKRYGDTLVAVVSAVGGRPARASAQLPSPQGKGSEEKGTA